MDSPASPRAPCSAPRCSGVFALGAQLGLPNAAFTLFEWLTRVLPGRVVIFGLETTLRALEALGLSIKDASKATEEALALTELFAASAVAGLVFFAVMRPAEPAVARRRGTMLGAAAGALMLLPVVFQGGGASVGASRPGRSLGAARVPGLGLGAGRAVRGDLSAGRAGAEPAGGGKRRPVDDVPACRSRPSPRRRAPCRAPVPATRTDAAPPEPEVVRLDRRHFLIRMGGLVATFVVLGAEVAEVLRVAGGPPSRPSPGRPIPFPNAGSPVKPVPGTRPEYTSVAEHYRVDIDLSPPNIDAADWRLRISGLVAGPLELTLDQLRSRLPRARPVRHPGVHLEPGRRAAHRHHPVERPFLPRRPGDGTAAAVGALRAPARPGRVRRGRRPRARSGPTLASSSPTTGTANP